MMQALYAVRMIIALGLGCIFGFITAAPIAGPISALIFTLGMKGRQIQGRWVALGAALVEGAYSYLAFWGFNQFFSKMSYLPLVSKGLASLILGALGIYFFRSKKMRTQGPASNRLDHHTHPKSFLVGAGLSAVNPSLLATWTAAITTLYSMHLFEFSVPNCLLFSVGVSVGIVLWFWILLKFLVKHRNNLNPGFLDKGLKAMGCLLIGLALWTLIRLFTNGISL